MLNNMMKLATAMLKTPDYVIEDNTVYPPAEDTFLLLDALEKSHKELLELNANLVVEIGCGSGVVTTFFYQLLDMFGKAPKFSICTDVNPAALRCTQKTGELNSIPNSCLSIINCNMLMPLMNRLENSVDVLLFNPPYVPSEQPASSIDDYYYAGGENGRTAIDHSLGLAAKVLAPRGVFYLVALKANKIDEIRASALTKFQLHSQIVLERRCGIEYLYVLRFTRYSS